MNEYIYEAKTPYKATYLIDTILTVLPTIEVLTRIPSDNSYNTGYDEMYIEITTPSESKTVTDSDLYPVTTSIKLSKSGTYVIRYYGTITRNAIITGIPGPKSYYSISYYISAVENHLPLKQWTITDVINRLFDVCEPIRRGEKPRFKLNAEQAERFDKILAPQFSFTKQTLRECLQDVGKVVHGEPRLTPKKDDTGWYYEVSYDMYAGTDRAGIYVRPYIQKTVSQVIDSYASYLDSNAENLVNQLDKYSGVITEPYTDGAKTVRTENQYVRIEESNMLIATQFPIYSVEKLEYIYTTDGAVKSVDITPWLFEKSVYDTQLSSYSEQYPYSKAYGLYYSQGSKNIGGLNFKIEGVTAIGSAFKSYAIINILRQALGNTKYEITNYPEMKFRVKYTPFYNVRVAQTKSNYKDFKRPAGLIFNQSSNVIETKYYGENLKGAIARLGTVEKSKTYILSRLSQIPKAGQLYNDDYYISAVAVEYLPTCIKCTIGLSKDFNRLSQYIGISSVKRFSEVSQDQAVERNTLWREYIVIGKQETPDEDSLIGQAMLFETAFIFAGTERPSKPITNVLAWGTSKSGSPANAVNLPVISSAFGNSIAFSWQYEDNYSAGAVSQSEDVGGVSGYWQNDYQYCDYYGRIYYYNFDLQLAGSTDDVVSTAFTLPAGQITNQSSEFVSTIGKTPYVLRKDSREILQCNFQIDFVTNDPALIIGSALASNCPAVREITLGGYVQPKLYVLPNEINKFTEHLEAYDNLSLSDLPSVNITISSDDSGEIKSFYVSTLNNATFPASGKAWAIVTAQTTTQKQVEDENGNEVTQYETTGGDVLLAQNIEITAGQAFTPIYFTKKREIFDKTVWKDIR